MVAQNNFATNAANGIGSANASGGPGGPGRGPDFDAIAETLNVNAETLRQAMEDAGGRGADLAKVAEALGVDEDALRAAMPAPPQQ